ncbi:1-(5-phosphoribosyl)-5-[(5-phosphoribosylamino)methylideneamino]imidazole-4-carboxamide isomerase [Lactiplantibacillus fabifermentans]|uniref:1-(5-phosphoribosyl)-5-[(5-phosphoribosylamino)methylideneamino] imidazole-4-carboxamide isomerase n=2 Tax=Lactiplantibacillus fabifermentans TaxID=483011 RepID=A0A0R2NUY7_9LACO|nr:1-(5-phosphoribosyl)-5-[(5-phosphoribosylamino)methylideneamino]imidazole-4-carboxamide isomerase [Lactiplantibacillus fabifermentans]ETY73643.1 1-(5-phosphoribosyl)-5-[(5-phosphoribosylamino)methylideneamino] imidazole-4-carboxamide isomerase [Lactiplantibacillus fabifermentans T30PCM01]KRO29180.1 phosphoribosylformimino-5-aminoimidazole carboxamideribotide isomerase [Lactiplantibacillus fabifermentans DSM 21115]
MIFPAIDLKGGQSVRLYQGDYEQTTLINADPVQQAQQINAAGLKQLHLVDLDGAKSGQPENLATITAIRQAFDGTLELGGGIRTYDLAVRYLQLGIDRLIIGSAALTNPALVQRLLQEFGGARIVIGVDGNNGQVAINGWLEQSQTSMRSLIATMMAAGAQNFIVTDVARDGTMQGPNLALLTTLHTELPAANLVASGGIRDVADLQTLQAAGIDDAIIGKALYEGTVTLEQLAEV